MADIEKTPWQTGSSDMLRRIIFLAFTTGPFIGAAMAQQADGSIVDDPGLAKARAVLQAGREDIIRQEIYLTASEAEAFWPVYRDYVADLQPLRDRRTEAIAAYLLAYDAGTLSAADAEKLVDEHLDWQASVLEIKRRHLENVRRVLPPLKAARFYQLENKLDAEQEAQLAVFVPLIDPA